ncbi:MAG: NAD(P)/FAD-dependent oxidoreductase [Candidatus Omnitrophota bacterium]|nr:MAG: NAD(P)/FAD-dependent oxidoreductase [Candidatus Omnitrophota bacterium]
MIDNEITIIGAGVIGLAIADKLSESGKNIVVLDKEPTFGQEISSRNSEVIHAGLYYPPNSLKAKTCIRGRELLYDLCQTHNIGHKKLGKLVVASNDAEIEKIEKIYENATQCGVKNLRLLKEKEISELEPAVCAKEAIFSPDSGIIDTHALMDFFFHKAKEKGVMFSFSTEVIGVKKQNNDYEITVKEPSGETFAFITPTVINSAGLYADKIAQMPGINIEDAAYKLHYCKGQYFRIAHPKKFSINHLVYPPATKIDLGIHLTLDLGGGLRLGPDAKYIPSIDYNINEADSAYFYESVQKFLPSLSQDDLIPDTAGIRPKLQKETEDFRDFVINEESDKGFGRFINLIGIESPGLTGCLAIAEIVEKLANT